MIHSIYHFVELSINSQYLSVVNYVIRYRSNGRFALTEQRDGGNGNYEYDRALYHSSSTMNLQLRVDPVRAIDVGIYQCRATGPHDSAQALSLVTLSCEYFLIFKRLIRVIWTRQVILTERYDVMYLC